MMLSIRMLLKLLPVATCRWCPRGGLSHGQTAFEPASRGGGGIVNYEVSRDSRFQPPNTLLKQEELQLAYGMQVFCRRMDRSGSLRFGMDRGYGSACGFRLWSRAMHFDSQPFICTLHILASSGLSMPKHPNK